MIYCSSINADINISTHLGPVNTNSIGSVAQEYSDKYRGSR